ncbi:MAG: hypothetical protein AUJ92_09930 [Armatimonadetes bacterium CG2_30_59_28]|nr:cytochrome c3 family protein [Armatimonadota bacterium]OIO94517.1 MAG: hypothetical protein AUJ92_09930 [Armatimonadetes bacterium CG2_30_59_28]PIU61215.1 MAG: hypothetical protein COS85_21335 [Armatimonadetes bacterium CG07_land_8_20_14_0_80_59_28]PIY41320.1 MAG: hypothetical protein COZ05_15850 [Armatimonadetes bacterium CG_4_10_14_3_um_filter_59_10]PJB65514.1 MAG: hypothetical protein CO095_13995 [Armatimonadetes bacterium CG_4_9_14_3_um_filter_58_7]
MKKLLTVSLIYAYFGVIIVVIGGLRAYWNKYKAPPDQPINFPHQIHVTKVGLKCFFCHSNADKSIHATVPPVSRCMSCHKAVATDRPEIQKLTGYWKEKRPIQWAQVHKLPDFVYFSHKRHMKKGVACETCHGQVGAMMKMRRVRSLTMGWCISCHRLHQASTDCATCHK